MIGNLVKLVLDKGGYVSHLKIPSTVSKGTGLCNPSIFIDNDGTILLNLRNVGYVLYLCENEQKFSEWYQKNWHWIVLCALGQSSLCHW